MNSVIKRCKALTKPVTKQLQNYEDILQIEAPLLSKTIPNIVLETTIEPKAVPKAIPVDIPKAIPMDIPEAQKQECCKKKVVKKMVTEGPVAVSVHPETRKLSTYHVFIKEKREELMKSHPKLSKGDIFEMAKQAYRDYKACASRLQTD